MNKLLSVDFVVLEKKTARAAMLRDACEMKIPRHIAVIMDGNRRYGKNNKALTVFAFSTENWNREQSEVDALMTLFNQFMYEIVPEALKRDIRVRVLVSDGRKLPAYIVEAIEEIETKTQHCKKFSLNLCVSYGARDEIVGACKKIATEVANGETSVEDINEELLSQRMLTAGLPDPDILIRTSGELRISNFLLFQIAYSELIFMNKMWPEVTKDDVQGIIVEFNRRNMTGKGDTRRSHVKKTKSKDNKDASTTERKDSPVAEASKSEAQAPPPAKPAAMKTKFCLNCQKDLTRNIRITCAECLSQPPFELCVECFAVGIELGEHKKSHRYTVSDCLAFPIVHEPPSTENAPSAPAAVGTNAAAFPTTSSDTANAEWTADEELLLLEGIEMFGMGNWKDIAEHVVTKSDKKCEKHYLTAYLGWNDLMPRFIGDVIEETKEEEKIEDQKMTTDEKAAEMNLASDNVMRGPPGERNGPSQLAGYMPLRGDFDVECDNEAEVILADMEFSDGDHPAERELKLKVIQIYNEKLAKRIERKKFVVERGLLDYKLHQHTERKRPKEERELLAQVRPFARFQTPEEHDNFVEGLIAAMRLKKQILLLQEYRKNGVKTLAEAELYDAEKKKRELDQAIQKQRDNASYLYESGRTSSSRDRANRWQNREHGASSDAGGENSRTRGSAGGLNTIAATFSIEGTPGCHLLTPKEKELCCKLKLLPKHYLVIKDALVRECYRLGYLTKKMAKETVQIDVNKTGQVYDFFVKCGWVKSESATPTVAASLNTKSPKKGKKPAAASVPVIAKEEQSVTPAKRKAAEMEAGTNFMGNILEEIAAQRRLDVAAAQQVVSADQLVKKIESTEGIYGSALAVLDRLNAPAKEGWSDVALAAEFKRASPSKGDIATELNLREQVKAYADAGASMISVLTEPKWFKGSLDDMMAAREIVEGMSQRPAILRKDFIIDVYQLLEARAYGADCVLLIVALLSQEQLIELIDATHNLGMCALVEVNSVQELDIALAAKARLIGVNNRDLRTFKVDM
ncbi:Transcriptional adapter 2-alpha, partial [Phytophthora palmivora]